LKRRAGLQDHCAVQPQDPASTRTLRAASAYSAGTPSSGAHQEQTMSHQPPKQNKKKPQHTAKEKKSIKQQKKHASDQAPFIKQ
jgi:hypothetical protein